MTTKTASQIIRTQMIDGKLGVMNSTRGLTMHQLSQCGSIKDIEDYIKRRWEWFWLNGLSHERDHYSNSSISPHSLTNINFRMHWGERISNAYRCPVNGKTNLYRMGGVPTCYPGWTGKMDIVIKPPLNRSERCDSAGFSTDYFKNTLIHTKISYGGIGYTNRHISYVFDVTLWAADFPVMYEQHRRAEYLANETKRRSIAWKALGGELDVPPFTDIPDDWKFSDPLIALPLEAICN